MIKTHKMPNKSAILKAGILLILIACWSSRIYAYDYDDPYGAEPGGALWYQENSGAIANGEFSQLPTPSATAASYLPNLTEFTEGYNVSAGVNAGLNDNIYGVIDAPMDAGFINDPYGAEPGGALWYQENVAEIASGSFSQLPTPSGAASNQFPGIDNYVNNYNLTSGANPFANNHLDDLFAAPDINNPLKNDIFPKITFPAASFNQPFKMPYGGPALPGQNDLTAGYANPSANLFSNDALKSVTGASKTNPFALPKMQPIQMNKDNF